MIAVELISKSRSAAAIGPWGSRMPSEQPPSIATLTSATAGKACRMLDLVNSGSRAVARKLTIGHRPLRSDYGDDPEMHLSARPADAILLKLKKSAGFRRRLRDRTAYAGVVIEDDREDDRAEHVPANNT